MHPTLQALHVDETVLHRTFRLLADRDLPSLDLASALGEVTGAMPGLFGADGAGILVLDDAHTLRHVSSTDPAAHALEEAQESTGRGPCVEALVENSVIVVADLLSDDRWPGLGELLAPAGVRAVLGMPVRVGGIPIGSIDIYTHGARVWDESDTGALESIEMLVERLLTGAIVAERSETLIAQLQRALEARVAVERAIGVLMAAENLDAPGAFERIRQAARSSRRSVHAVSASVVARKRLT